MSFSLNEVEATARKAARGAGYAWGMADEAGRAVRWLCAHGIDGCGALAGLVQADGEAGVCPLVTGCMIADLGVAQAEFAQVRVPVLVVPFVARMAQAKACRVALVTDHGKAVIDGDGVMMRGDLRHTATIQMAVTADFLDPPQTASRAEPDAADWAILNAFAQRTYAPATEESRRKGAG